MTLRTSRVSTKLPDYDDIAYSDAVSETDTSTAEGLEKAVVMFMLTGAFNKWPMPIFGPAIPDGETKHL